MTEKPAPPASERVTVKVTLPTPIQRGETEIAEVTLRKPRSGELRGVKLSELLQSDVGSILLLLPRITEPALIQQEVDALEPENLIALSGEIVGFFLTPAERAMLEMQQAATPLN